MMIIRAGKIEDVPAILEIYNDAILNTTAVYSYEPVTLEDRQTWFATKAQKNFPVLVAELEGHVAGFSSYGSFRAWPAYLHTIESSIYVAKALRYRGIGKALLAALLETAKTQQVHAFIAGIDASNEASLRLHQHFGFEKVAHFKEVGFKFGRWLDLVFMERILD